MVALVLGSSTPPAAHAERASSIPRAAQVERGSSTAPAAREKLGSLTKTNIQEMGSLGVGVLGKSSGF